MCVFKDIFVVARWWKCFVYFLCINLNTFVILLGPQEIALLTCFTVTQEFLSGQKRLLTFYFISEVLNNLFW